MNVNVRDEIGVGDLVECEANLFIQRRDADGAMLPGKREMVTVMARVHAERRHPANPSFVLHTIQVLDPPDTWQQPSRGPFTEVHADMCRVLIRRWDLLISEPESIDD